jgi:adenylate kinase
LEVEVNKIQKYTNTLGDKKLNDIVKDAKNASTNLLTLFQNTIMATKKKAKAVAKKVAPKKAVKKVAAKKVAKKAAPKKAAKKVAKKAAPKKAVAKKAAPKKKK